MMIAAGPETHTLFVACVPGIICPARCLERFGPYTVIELVVLFSKQALCFEGPTDGHDFGVNCAGIIVVVVCCCGRCGWGPRCHHGGHMYAQTTWFGMQYYSALVG